MQFSFRLQWLRLDELLITRRGLRGQAGDLHAL